ncbi:NUMOD4 domain-containing protein [Bradyrhizobium sp. AUGA SZCCT0431]|uniref:NUMOD4 domain-containing protein n=1 Tax=Bradyrhizobium sp. AUGA SZCCT0431 TaxID=2807674 RepID=UPI001BA85EA4|nr:NUMOD4 domain-containing protein [Bradyrhizobium sp. AUGA SZCCT0431]MBR1146665.1 NUMOD4 motif-containing HNH endonuclease [Bradyrhizobium sp. AUGA SZCCT0431]
MSHETWKDAVGYEGFYQISSKGRVRSASRLINSPWGVKSREYEGQIKKSYIGKHGYVVTSFYIDGKMKLVKLHRLLAMAFIPNPENKPQVNHKNGVKHDNTLSNLEWATGKENMRHAIATGLKPSPKYAGALDGEKCYRATTTGEIVLKIRAEYKNGATTTFLAAKYGLGLSAVVHMVHGRSWRHLPL